MEEDYPGQNDEVRRERLIRKAVEAGDRILTSGADGSVEELDWMTSRVAERWVEKVTSAMSTKLLRRDLVSRGFHGLPDV